MRRLAVILLVLAGLLVGADFLLRNTAEARAAREIAANLDLDEGSVEVAIEGFPFITQAVGGRIDRVSFESTDVRKQGIELDRVTAHLNDVRFELGSIIRGKGTVRARSGSGAAIADVEALNERLRGELPVEGGLTLQGETATFSSDATGEVPVHIALEGGTLIVAPEGVASVALPLPVLGGGVRFESIAVRAGQLVLSFVVDGSALRLG